MNPERWQEVDDLLQAVLAQEPANRATFLDEACADENLRAEVESLLSFGDDALSLIDAPACEVAAFLFSQAQPALAEGESIAHYRILSFLGAGGMGEVYLAQDTKLERKVALKLLPTDYTFDGQRLHRFRQEARAASALNHPNIITIYELGEYEQKQFIATEFVEGETLRQRMTRKPLRVIEALDVVIQTTGALAAAHKAGIVHRDIKPENLMLRPDGYVKVLDFGVAKLLQQEEEPPREEIAAAVNISSGLVMGTVKYMSPEQAGRLPVDARSDVFSLGVVLYEMLTGHAPFKGTTIGDLLGSILKEDARPLTEYMSNSPDKLQRIVTKALSKDPAKRQQTAEELLADLQTARGQLEAQQSALGLIQRHKFVVAVAAIVLIVASVALLSLVRRPGRPGTAHSSTITKIVGPSVSDRAVSLPWQKYVAVSPDGKSIARVVNETGHQSLWLQEFATGSMTQIIPPAAVSYQALFFAPDGKSIYYCASAIGSVPPLYQINVTDGTSIKLIDRVPNGYVSLSPDGKRFVFLLSSETGLLLRLANADGTEQRDVMNNPPIGPMAWSPNGKRIVCASRSEGSLIEISVDDWSKRPISSQKWDSMKSVLWIADGTSLILNASEPNKPFTQIWQVSYPDGHLRNISNSADDYTDISMTGDSSKLFAVRESHLFNVWVAPSANIGDEHKISFSDNDGEDGVAWSSDGRIMYVSTTSGSEDIWIMNADGSERKQLTSQGANFWPAVSPDAQFIAWVSTRSGTQSVWRMKIDGTDQKQLTNTLDVQPEFTVDGKWIIYSSLRNQPRSMAIWKLPVDGGEPSQITEFNANVPHLSPDGRLLACRVGPPLAIAVAPFTGNLISRPDTSTLGDRSRLGSLVFGGTTYQWSPDSRAVTYIVDANGVSNIWSQPLDGSPPKQLTNFTSDHIVAFAWSRDGKYLAAARGNIVREVVLISDFR